MISPGQTYSKKVWTSKLYSEEIDISSHVIFIVNIMFQIGIDRMKTVSNSFPKLPSASLCAVAVLLSVFSSHPELETSVSFGGFSFADHYMFDEI